MSIWSWAWVSWIAAFLVIEGLALKRKGPNNTLSEAVWAVFAIGRPGDRPKFTGWVQLRRVARLAGIAWLAAHFLTGGAV